MTTDLLIDPSVRMDSEDLAMIRKHFAEAVQEERIRWDADRDDRRKSFEEQGLDVPHDLQDDDYDICGTLCESAIPCDMSHYVSIPIETEDENDAGFIHVHGWREA